MATLGELARAARASQRSQRGKRQNHSKAAKSRARWAELSDKGVLTDPKTGKPLQRRAAMALQQAMAVEAALQQAGILDALDSDDDNE